MVLVIAQHAYHFVHPEAASETLGTAIYTGTRMASVAFMAISGMMISYFLQTRASPHEVVVRYRRRAVFLLLAAHPAIRLARFFNVDTEGNTPVQELIDRMVFDFPITDTIALCLLVAPPLLLRLRRNQIAMLAGVLLVGTLPVMIFWHPESVVGRVTQEVYFGWRSSGRVLSIGWPLIPWLGILQIAVLTAFAMVATGCCAYAYGRLRRWIAFDDYRALVGLRDSSVLRPVVQSEDSARRDRTSR